MFLLNLGLEELLDLPGWKNRQMLKVFVCCFLYWKRGKGGFTAVVTRRWLFVWEFPVKG